MPSVVLDFIRFQDKVCGHCVIEYDIQNPEPAVIGRNYRNANLSPADYTLYEVRKICFIVLRIGFSFDLDFLFFGFDLYLFPDFALNFLLFHLFYISFLVLDLDFLFPICLEIIVASSLVLPSARAFLYLYRPAESDCACK